MYFCCAAAQTSVERENPSGNIRTYTEDEISGMSVSDTANMIQEWAKFCGKVVDASKLVFDGRFLMSLSIESIFFLLKSREDAEALYRYLHPDASGTASTAMEETSGPNQQQIEEQRALFAAPYIDPTNMVTTFVTYAEACFDHYQANAQTYNSPYFCLVQSSGYGKTRLLREVARKVRVMYVCMRSDAARVTGYPRHTATAMTALFEGLNRSTASTYVDGLAERFGQCVQSALTKLPPPGVDDETSEASFPSERLAGSVWNFKDVHLPANPQEESELVILVLDEARASLDVQVNQISQFRLIRRALARFAKKFKMRRFVAVFVDTSSRIKNFSPSADLEPSLRPTQLDDELIAPKLFMPFILRNSFDVNFKPLQGNDLSSLVDSDDYLRAGRPLVSMPSSESIVHGRRSISGLTKQLSFLSRKLHGGQSQRTRAGALSEMLCRLGASVHPHHPYAREMVADYMATLLGTDNERKSMLVAYVAEPKLAIAAADSWSSESLFANELAPALQHALMSGAVSQGARGELVSQILWLFAFDKAAQLAGKGVGECVELEQVLTQLLPADSDIDISKAIPIHLQGSKLACCQFVNIMDRFSTRIHVQAAQRHCGISFRDGKTGVDLAFPLFMKKLSILLVQIKNRADMQYPNSKTRSACIKMRPEFAFAGDNFDPREIKEMGENSVCVFMQVGAKNALAALEPGSSSYPTLQIFGLGSRCLQPAVRSCLETLIDGRLNFQNFFRYQYSTRDKSEPSPDSENLSVSAWPFICDDSSNVRSGSRSKSSRSVEIYDFPKADTQNDDVYKVAKNVTVKHLKEICKQYGLQTKGSKSILLQRVLFELPPGVH